MEFNLYKDKAFEISNEFGCDFAELYMQKRSNVSAQVREGELSDFKSSNKIGANLRVVIGTKSGYAYTEEFSNPKSLVEKAMDNAKIIENEEERPAQSFTEYKSFEKPLCPAQNMSAEELIKTALKLEEYAKNSDDRFLRVKTCYAGKDTKQIGIYNTLGLSAQYDVNTCEVYVTSILKQGEELKDGLAWYRNEKFNSLLECAKEATKKASLCFNAKSMPSGKYKILLENEAAAAFLTAFVGVFSAENTQKKLSLLQGKEGEKIASDIVNITDDPFNLTAPRPFDKEGVPSEITNVVENGVLKTLLYDLKTAKIAGVKSTSNAGRLGAAGELKVIPSNLYIKGTQSSKQELINKMQNGIIISDLAGIHSGVSMLSGDFSLLANGLLVENGEIKRAVDQITIAGNFFEVLKNIEGIANDLYFDYDAYGQSDMSIGSPSFIIGEIAVSGE